MIFAKEWRSPEPCREAREWMRDEMNCQGSEWRCSVWRGNGIERCCEALIGVAKELRRDEKLCGAMEEQGPEMTGPAKERR